MKEKISKITAANVQLNTALELFFSNKSSITVITLAYPAWHIVKDLLKHHKIASSRDWIRDDHPQFMDKEVWNTQDKDWNFLKHAKDDPEAFLDFDDSYIETILFFIINDFSNLAPQTTLMDFYQLWFIAKNQAIFSNYPVYIESLSYFPNMKDYDLEKQKKIFLQKLKEY